MSEITKALMKRKKPRAAAIMGDKQMGGVIDSTVNQPGGLYAGYPGAPVQPLPAPRRRRRP